MASARGAHPRARWALQDAKNRFSEVVDAALRGEPQIVTRRGIETAVIIAHDDYARLAAAHAPARPPLSEYLLSPGAVAHGEPFERIHLPSRDDV